MRRAIIALLTMILGMGLLLAGCRSDLPARFSRLSQPMPCRGPVPMATVDADFAWCEGMTATLTVHWVGGLGPYTVGANMGGGTTEDVPAGTAAASPFTHVFTLTAPGTYTYTVTIKDANGIPGTTTGTYTIDEKYTALGLLASYNRPNRLLSVAVLQVEGADVTVEMGDLPAWVDIPQGLMHHMPGGSGELEFTLSFLPHEENTCTIKVSVTDTQDNHEVETVDIARPLFIEFAYYHPGRGHIRIAVDATWEQTVTVDLAPPEGVTVEGELTQTEDGGGEYVFQVSWDEETFGGGEAVVEVADQFGNADSATIPLYTAPESYEPDTLYAFPLQSGAARGEPVRIVVATGVPANPFQYMNGVAVVFDSGEPSFVGGSFNVGAPGGDIKEPDGIWAAVNPLGFLLAPDFMMAGSMPESWDEETGSRSFGFNVTPLGGCETNDGSGELFNFEVEFARPGIVTMGFVEYSEIKRTYYSDGTSAEHYWGDISNDHAGALNTVYVE